MKTEKAHLIPFALFLRKFLEAIQQERECVTQLTVEANKKKSQAVGCAAGLERSSEKLVFKKNGIDSK